LTEQLCEGSMRARLAEFRAYYSNRMSYDEVAGLLERVTGQPGLRDQPRQHVVVAKAVEVRRQGQHACQADTAAPPFPVVRSQGDWYAPQSCVLDTFFCLGGFGSYRRLWSYNAVHFSEVH
jgi:hypothetical protein